jgi:gas vesicle protein
VEGKSVPAGKKFEVDAPKYALSRGQKTGNAIGWTLLIGAFAGIVGLLVSLVYAPPSSMRGQDGRKFSLFEHVFRPSVVKAENRAALEESASKKLIEIQKAKRDSAAEVERARNDSIKAAMAAKKMKPRAQPMQGQKVRIPQKH